MPTNFPTTIDALPNPTPTEPLSQNPHSDYHTNANDAIEALETKVGVNNSAVPTSLDYKVSNIASSDPGHKHTLANGATDVTATFTEVNQLAGVTVGGNATGDIVTTDGTQDLSNKTVTDKLTFDANPFTNLQETNTEPGAPVAGDVYLDDGTNTASGLPSLRRYTGTVWEDISGGSPSPLTAKGDLYTFDTDDVALPVGTDGLMLKANSATATGLEWGTPTTGGGGGVPYFLHEEVSAIGGGYRKILNTPADDAENTDTAVVNSGTGEVLIRAFASDAGNPNASIWLSGIWNFDTWASVDAPTGTTTIVIRVYKRTDPGGVETELFNITTDEINAGTATLISKETVQAEETTNTTDRLVVKYFAQTTSAVNRTVTLYYEGTANYSHFHAPFQTQAVSPLTTKGDLYGFTTVDARVPVGANDKVLTADSTVSAGIAWKDASSQALVKGEVPSGAIDSSNVTYTLAVTPVTGSVQLYLNGIRLKLTDDYTITGGTITMNTAPITGDILLADYATSTGTFATGSTSFIYNETPTGTIDGSNTVFDTASNFVAGSILVYLDGQLQKPGASYDYVETDANTITFNTAPVLGSVLLVSYQSAVSTSGNADTVDGYSANATPTANQIPVLDSNALLPETIGTYRTDLTRQAFINSNFDIWQRSTSTALSDVTITFVADRWREYIDRNTGTLPTLTRSRQLLTSGDIPNSHYYSRLNTNGSGTGLGINSYHDYGQTIEYGGRYLAGAGRTVTLSFYARSSIVGKKIGTYLLQYYGTGGSPSASDFVNGTNWTLTSTWTKYTHTYNMPTLSGKTFGTANNDYLFIALRPMWGTSQGVYVGSGVAETYVGSGDIDIAQVQLCAGSKALSYEPKSYIQELSLCQRYYMKFTNANGGVASPWGVGVHSTATTSAIFVNFPVSMKLPIAPIDYSGVGTVAVTQVGTGRVYNTNLQIIDATTTTCEVTVTVAGGLTAGQGTFGTFANGATNYVAFNCEQ